ncbi:MAG: permease [Salinirussus sp.]
MSSEASSVPGDEREGDPGSGPGAGVGEDGVLFSVYRRYIGEPEGRREVYLGFGVFFAGIALGVVGLGLFLLSGSQPTGSDPFWQLREVALVAAMLALPAIALSVTILLSVGRRTAVASVAGAVFCTVAAAWLTQVYPYQWTAAGNDISVISAYAAGLVLLAAATGSSLVAQYVDRVAPDASDEAPTGREAAGETVTDEEVASDIEEAMSESTLSWGGVEQAPNTERLKLDLPDEQPETAGSEEASATETRSAGDDVDQAVDGLRQLQGGTQEEARAESPDDQVDALAELRQRREAEAEREPDRGAVGRLYERLFE